MTDAEALCRALSRAENLPEPLLRRAIAQPDLVAEETLRLLSAAVGDAEPTPEQDNLLFWGIHVLAHARDARLLAPLLRFLREDEETVDAVLGDAVTTTLARMIASLFDGRTDRLFPTDPRQHRRRRGASGAARGLRVPHARRPDRAGRHAGPAGPIRRREGRGRGRPRLDGLGGVDRLSRVARTRAQSRGGAARQAHHRRIQRRGLVQGDPARGRAQAGRPVAPGRIAITAISTIRSPSSPGRRRATACRRSTRSRRSVATIRAPAAAAGNSRNAASARRTPRRTGRRPQARDGADPLSGLVSSQA